MAGDKHKKKTKGKKAAKRSAAKHKKSLEAGGDGEGSEGAAVPSGKQRNPKAFTVTSRGRAKLQRARTAEKEQKRLHGASKREPTFLVASRARHRLCLLDSGLLAAISSLCSCATVLWHHELMQPGPSPAPQTRQRPWSLPGQAPCQAGRRTQAWRQRCVRGCSADGGACAGGATAIRGAGAGPARRGQVLAHPLPGQALHAPVAVGGQGSYHRRRRQDAPAHLCGVPPGAPESWRRQFLSCTLPHSGRQWCVRLHNACRRCARG